jgi:hypothetical protein
MHVDRDRALLGEGYGIADQVRQDLTQPVGIGAEVLRNVG